VSLPMFLSGLGLSGVAFGGFLVVWSERPEAHKGLQTSAGLLLIAGFACMGIACLSSSERLFGDFRLWDRAFFLGAIEITNGPKRSRLLVAFASVIRSLSAAPIHCGRGVRGLSRHFGHAICCAAHIRASNAGRYTLQRAVRWHSSSALNLCSVDRAMCAMALCLAAARLVRV
jgi:hypothetical protein